MVRLICVGTGARLACDPVKRIEAEEKSPIIYNTVIVEQFSPLAGLTLQMSRAPQ